VDDNIPSIYRNYISMDEISVGDVVKTFTGAFESAIIVKIEDLTRGDRFPDLVHFERPMMRIDSTGGAWLHTEKFSAYRSTVFKNMLVYTNGPSGTKDNRKDKS